jgi:hypothetical protein
MKGVIKLSKTTTFPQIVYRIDGKEVTKAEVIKHLNKKYNPAATGQKKIS